MALIHCPECKKENVSDAADFCPNCGFSIKSYFAESKRKEIEEQQRLDRAKRDADFLQKRLNGVEIPKKPMFPVWVIIVAIAMLVIGYVQLSAPKENSSISIANGNGDPSIKGIVILIGSFILVGRSWYTYSSKLRAYRDAEEDIDAYRQNVIDYEDRMRTESASYSSQAIRCPNCGSHSASRMSTLGKAVSIGALGLASSKLGKSYKCNSCGYTW